MATSNSCRITIKRLFSSIHKRFLQTSLSSSAASTSSSLNSTVLEFLINSQGLPLTTASLSVSKTLKINQSKIQNVQALVQLLKSHDFSSTHIATLIEKRPQLLHLRAEGNIKPKFQLLVEYGFVGQPLPQLIVSNPTILTRALRSLRQSFEFLKYALGNDMHKILAVIKRSSWLLLNPRSAVQPNFDLLIKEGVHFDRIAKLIAVQPRTIYQKHDRIVYAVNSLKNLGFEPKDAMFIHALRVMTQMTESTWNKKIDVLKSLGWTEEEIQRGFKSCPQILGYSEKKIRATIDFLLHNFKLEKQTIIAHPNLLVFSIDKTLRPRHEVLKVLLSKKLIKGSKKMHWLITISKKKFLDNYVVKYTEEVPGLLQIYGRTSNALRTDT